MSKKLNKVKTSFFSGVYFGMKQQMQLTPFLDCHLVLWLKKQHQAQIKHEEELGLGDGF